MSSSPSPGSVIGGFELGEILGEGGMGVVWSAEQVSLGRPAAVKIIRPHLSRDEQFRLRFLKEVRTAASLDNPNIVTVFDGGESDDCLYLAMALVDGADLAEILEMRGALEPETAVAILCQTASGVQAVHDAGLLHRDIKPANILVRESDATALLADFGLARTHEGTRATETGMLVGTLDYMAPEQFDGGPVDKRADVYALGAVLFESLVGEPPFRHDSAAAQMYAHLREPPPKPSDYLPALERFDAVIETAMAKEPSERPPSAADLAYLAQKALESPAVVAESFRTTVTEIAALPASTRQHRRRPGFVRPIPNDSRDQDPRGTIKGGGSVHNEEPRRRMPIYWVGALVAITLIVAGAAIAFAMSQRGSDSRSVVRSVLRETVVVPGVSDGSVNAEQSSSTPPEGSCGTLSAMGASGRFVASNIQISGIDCGGARAMIASGPSSRANAGWNCPLTGDKTHTDCVRGSQSVSWDITELQNP